MDIWIHPHARGRMEERGTTEEEIIKTVEEGERFPARFGRTGFRRNFSFGKVWKGRAYKTKQIEAYGVKEGKEWIIITVMVKYF
ncbi:MAG TPA: hypothetical protein ACFYED_02755 [Candidatus Tripitaka californicus]|uniref:hypothetical protein n=2 Tax=Candidatus Tripitaka californicus TaxID=3367616 RepID=UPI004025A5D5|nr:DUF4258 domain-containing protein [Planctomycetota bacterium]